MSRKLTLIAMLMALVLAAPAAALADSMFVSYTLGDKVWYVLDGVSDSDYTAEFDIMLEGDQIYYGSDYVSGIGYCVDLGHTINSGQEYYVGETIASSDFTSGQMAAAWLMHTYAPGLTGLNYVDNNWKRTVTSLQAAIWEVIYDDDYSTVDTSGDFYLQDRNYDWLKLSAQQMLDSIPDEIRQYDIAWSAVADDVRSGGPTGPQKQSLIVGAATPEPGTLLLFGSAAGIAGYLRRRARKKRARA